MAGDFGANRRPGALHGSEAFAMTERRLSAKEQEVMRRALRRSLHTQSKLTIAEMNALTAVRFCLYMGREPFRTDLSIIVDLVDRAYGETAGGGRDDAPVRGGSNPDSTPPVPEQKVARED